MDDKTISVKDIMTENFISVGPDMPIADAAKVLADNKFDGVPVVEDGSKLVGILTEYDLISSGSAGHLPTLQTVLKNLSAFREDRKAFEAETREISSLRVRDIMNKDPLTLPESVTYEEVIKTFQEHHRVNPIPVINDQNIVVGVVSRFDVLKPYRM